MHSSCVRFFCLLSALLPLCSHAALTPVVTSATATAGARPWVTVKWTTVETEGDSSIIPSTPLGQYGLVLYYANSPPNEGYDRLHLNALYNTTFVSSQGLSWNAAAERFILAYGRSGSATWVWDWRPAVWQVCIGSSAAPSYTRPHVGAPITAKGSVCVDIPPAPSACTPAGSAMINHGTLTRSLVDGNRASTKITLQCSEPATVKLQIQPPKIDLGGGVYSTLTVNGLKSGGIIKGDGSTVLNIESVLEGTQGTAGMHSGSSVLMLDVQ